VQPLPVDHYYCSYESGGRFQGLAQIVELYEDFGDFQPSARRLVSVKALLAEALSAETLSAETSLFPPVIREAVLFYHRSAEVAGMEYEEEYVIAEVEDVLRTEYLLDLDDGEAGSWSVLVERTLLE
jgi:hypothetical protein